MRLLTLSLSALILAGVLPTQTWHQIPLITANPRATINSEMVYDVARGRAVLFGGTWVSPYGFVTMNETWEYDGTSWTLSPSTPPPTRGFFAMAYDVARGRTVVFGGTPAQGPAHSETWEYDGVTWTQVFPTASPSPRADCHMVYDVARSVCVMFGGGWAGGHLTDTWEWDGTNWTQVATATAPPGRQLAAMAYDVARGRTVLFGGSYFATPLNDTWEYDGTNWVQVITANSPPPLGNVEMTYDWTTGETILFGGRLLYFMSTNDCWAYDGADWTDLSASTASFAMASRDSQSMCYDVARGVVVMYGGFNINGLAWVALRETWELPSAAPWVPFGTGCVGSAGIPELSLMTGSVPAIGTTFSLDVANLPAGGGLAYMITGFSDTVWNGTPLPLDLGPFGLPTCTLFVAPLPGWSGPFFHGGVSATWSKFIPVISAAQGCVFYNQVMVLDATAPNGKAAFSNAGRGVVK